MVNLLLLITICIIFHLLLEEKKERKIVMNDVDIHLKEILRHQAQAKESLFTAQILKN